jgi:hypothetical protein
MKLQEGGCGVAGTYHDFAGVRSLGDAEQQADHQIAPEQPRELLGKFGLSACGTQWYQHMMISSSAESPVSEIRADEPLV